MSRAFLQRFWGSVVIVTQLAMTSAVAAPRISTPADNNAPLPPVPQQPSAPPTLSRKKPTEPMECARFYVYRGQVMDCDSMLDTDGERLRPIIASVPSAVAELDEYQRNRRKRKTAAYVGSIGIALVLTGLLAPRFFDDIEQQKSIRRVGYLGGLGFMTAAGLYGFVSLRSNERHLGRAVQNYNQARPDDPITLQFSTGILF